jgi:hypothetical protein
MKSFTVLLAGALAGVLCHGTAEAAWVQASLDTRPAHVHKRKIAVRRAPLAVKNRTAARKGKVKHVAAAKATHRAPAVAVAVSRRARAAFTTAAFAPTKFAPTTFLPAPSPVTAFQFRPAPAFPDATPRPLKLNLSTALSAVPHVAPAKPTLAMVAPATPFRTPAWQTLPSRPANPYLVYATPASYAPAPAVAIPAPRPPAEGAPSTIGAWWNLTPVFGAVGEQSILPQIKTVYPTGEKPLVVVALKCPTELVGVSTPSSAMLHTVVSAGMNAINSTKLLSFNLQQVCE